MFGTNIPHITLFSDTFNLRTYPTLMDTNKSNGTIRVLYSIFQPYLLSRWIILTEW